jgi:ketosteroid isomerase-like protein
VTTSANLHLVRSIFAAWERGDYTSVAWAHPEIEYVFADGPDPGTWQGLAGVAEAYRNMLNAWDDLRIEADEYRELDRERVLVLTRGSGRGKTSGLKLPQMWTQGAHLFQVRQGKVTRFIAYWDRRRAFADLGLASEEPRDPR